MRQPADIESVLFWAYRGQYVGAAEADAILVAMAVAALPESHRRLVERFARAGHAPSWQAGEDQPVVSLASVRTARTIYREWRRSLTLPRRRLMPHLTCFSVTGPEMPKEPWRRSA